MELLPLQIFPPGGLSDSVITCVWVGVTVVAFFNLRLGWVLSGLVIPGYVVPLLLLKPWAALAIFIEGSVTYLLVWLFSDYLSRLGLWSKLFGRDRFFALIVASIGVRLLFDGLLFPWLGEFVSSRYGFSFDYINNLHSFGLIIVALLANNFWKPGYLRGTFTVLVTVGISYFIIRYGLMEWTNFNIGAIQYAYEDLASSILASPKAYIILVSTAFIASRMNLYYGWEYNGILIPSLLALQWYEPMKILTSFGEAFIILGISTLLLRLPLFARANIEGARKLLLFFNVGFFYKWGLSLVLATWWPEIKISDAFAFGYLLSSLMAIKMHDKEVVGLLTRATLQTSLVAVLLATLAGFALTWLPLPQLGVSGAAEATRGIRVEASGSGLIEQLRREKVAIYQRHGEAGLPLATPLEMDAFEQGMRLLRRYLASRDDALLRRAAAALVRAKYAIRRVDGHYLYVRELQPGLGRGVYVLDTQARGRLLIEIPAPAEERGSLDAGGWLFRLWQGRALALAGARRDSNPDLSADVLQSRDSYFQIFHRLFDQHDTLQVRGYTRANLRRLYRASAGALGGVSMAAPSSLWVSGMLPPGLQLQRLQGVTGGIDILWRDSGGSNRQRDASGRGFAELYLNEADRRLLLARSLTSGEVLRAEEHGQRIDGYLQDWLLGGKSRLARKGTDAYRPPRLEELLYLDQEVLTPLARLLAKASGPVDDQALDRVAAAAAVLDYRLIRYRHRRSGNQYLILEERQDLARPRFWGTVVFRLGPAQDYIVQVPRPLYEVNSFEYGVSLFERLKARMLVLAGAHPLSNLDGSADLVRMENIGSLFNLASQVMLREAADERPMLVIHSRAFGLRPENAGLHDDVILAFSDGITRIEDMPALGRRIVGVLQRDGFEFRLVDGSPATAGYEVGSLPQAIYASKLDKKYFCILWLSPLARQSYRLQTENWAQQKLLRALRIADTEADLASYLQALPRRPGARVLRGGMRDLLTAFMHSHDSVVLRAFQERWPDIGLQRVIDQDSRQSYLLLSDAGGVLFAVANINPRQAQRQVVIDPADDLGARVRHYIDSRAGWLIFGTGR